MSIELIVGPMFAGKTKELLYRIRQLKRNPANTIVCITHASDDRYSEEGRIVSHDQDSHPAIALQELMPFVADYRYTEATHVLIEEAQFFGDLFAFVTQAADVHGKGIVCAGLDGDFQRKPFGHMGQLLPYCDSSIKLRANCPSCSETGTAIFTARMRDKGTEQVYVGGKEVYRPMCRKHYSEFLL
jgi:thymidine kinase